MDRTLAEEFAAMGVAVELDEEPEEDGMAVCVDNWTSLRAFLACETQWRVVATMSRLVWLGLDYPAVKTVLDLYGLGREVFEDIVTMEAAALPVLNEAD